MALTISSFSLSHMSFQASVTTVEEGEQRLQILLKAIALAEARLVFLVKEWEMREERERIRKRIVDAYESLPLDFKQSKMKMTVLEGGKLSCETETQIAVIEGGDGRITFQGK